MEPEPELALLLLHEELGEAGGEAAGGVEAAGEVAVGEGVPCQEEGRGGPGGDEERAGGAGVASPHLEGGRVEDTRWEVVDARKQ